MGIVMEETFEEGRYVLFEDGRVEYVVNREKLAQSNREWLEEVLARLEDL